MVSSFGKILRMRRMPKIHRKIAYGPTRGGTTEYEHQFYFVRLIEHQFCQVPIWQFTKSPQT